MQNQIEGFQAIHAEELQKKEDALRVYRDSMETLEREYLKEKENIKTITEEKIVEIEVEIDNRKQFTENKQELADKVEDEFGFQYVP